MANPLLFVSSEIPPPESEAVFPVIFPPTITISVVSIRNNPPPSVAVLD